ncbi:cyanuric acid amidohydrolase [Plastoroseomonas arctica]|uniref:Cyanuric acid amidohydrolase n=1 Tax=Plastoroseomonas arctica TaxID=1509237 RepID=A0AAF1K1N7_9PROT|nr:ring-opening amidohydrolase [Plastoroseomonas arctica]MBR0654710.1 ring-opening amidohydrolase [Plastoroseomonas arctica]
MTRLAQAFRVPMRHPGDVSGIAALIASGELDPRTITAILGKTEGNGCVNDFTRAYAVQSLTQLLGPDSHDRIAMVMSGGTEGGLSPHFLILATAQTDAPSNAAGALAMATAFTRDFAPEEIGRMAQIHATAAAIRAAATQFDTIHFVQIKCPLLTSERIADAQARGHSVATHDTYHSMGLSRGASALGVALALNEIPETALSDTVIGADTTLFSRRASASAGVELMRNEILILGTSTAWAGDLTITHEVMADAIDTPALHRALHAADLIPQDGQLPAHEEARLIAILAKAEPSTHGTIRGARHTMNDDSDINATRHARALVGGVIAATTGRTTLFVSGGAEHQGPDGGGPVAVIARRRG